MFYSNSSFSIQCSFFPISRTKKAFRITELCLNKFIVVRSGITCFYVLCLKGRCEVYRIIYPVHFLHCVCNKIGFDLIFYSYYNKWIPSQYPHSFFCFRKYWVNPLLYCVLHTKQISILISLFAYFDTHGFLAC